VRVTRHAVSTTRVYMRDTASAVYMPVFVLKTCLCTFATHMYKALREHVHGSRFSRVPMVLGRRVCVRRPLYLLHEASQIACCRCDALGGRSGCASDTR
jgi:hypothetical protein